MIISSLCDYYELNKDKMLPQGYSKKKIQYLVVLSMDGKIEAIINLGRDDFIGNKKIVKYPEAIFPFRSEKTSKDLNIIEHRGKYLFGFKDFKNDEFIVDKTFFDVFRQGTIDFFENISSPLAQSFYNFAKNWEPEKNTKNQFLVQIGKGVINGSFAFAVSGRPDMYLNDVISVKEKWDKVFADKIAVENNVIAQCSIFGEKLPVARIHYKIRNIYGAPPQGCTLVCCNNESEESYGKIKSYNSNISYKAMREYTEALNYLLEYVEDSQISHKYFIGDMTVVHFALVKDEEAYAYVRYINNEVLGIFTVADEELADEPLVEDVEKEVGASLEHLSNGDLSNFEIQKSKIIDYCIFGIVYKDKRLSQRFFYRNNFGYFKQNVEKFYNDFKIIDSKRAPTVKNITKEIVPDKKIADKNNKDKKKNKTQLSSDLSEILLRSMLTGMAIPPKILQTVVQRVKLDSYDSKEFINDLRAGLIKACLNRNFNSKKEKIQMALDTQNTTPAYLCGRLFATLEKIQQDATKDRDLNRTIKNSYFASACATPALVFPGIIKLSKNHQEKLSTKAKIYYNNLLCAIIDSLDGEFPKTLSLEEQGIFIVGYYQQNKEFYTKKENITEEN